METREDPSALADACAGLCIRPLRRGELGQLHSLCAVCFGAFYSLDSLVYYTRRSRGGTFVATVNDTIVGFVVTVSPLLPVLSDRRGEIALIAVAPALRGRGIGRLLMERALRHLRRRGVLTARLHVNVSNHAAIGLYRNLGMREERVVHRYYSNGADAYVMTMRL